MDARCRPWSWLAVAVLALASGLRGQEPPTILESLGPPPTPDPAILPGGAGSPPTSATPPANALTVSPWVVVEADDRAAIEGLVGELQLELTCRFEPLAPADRPDKRSMLLFLQWSGPARDVERLRSWLIPTDATLTAVVAPRFPWALSAVPNAFGRVFADRASRPEPGPWKLRLGDRQFVLTRADGTVATGEYRFIPTAGGTVRSSFPGPPATTDSKMPSLSLLSLRDQSFRRYGFDAGRALDDITQSAPRPLLVLDGETGIAGCLSEVGGYLVYCPSPDAMVAVMGEAREPIYGFTTLPTVLCELDRPATPRQDVRDRVETVRRFLRGNLQTTGPYSLQQYEALLRELYTGQPPEAESDGSGCPPVTDTPIPPAAK